MDYRVNGRNLKRDEIKEIKREEADERNEKYRALPDKEKAAINPTRFPDGAEEIAMTGTVEVEL